MRLLEGSARDAAYVPGMPPKRPRSTPPAPTAAQPTAGASYPDRAPAPTRDQLPTGYAAFLAEVLARVRAAQLKTAVAVNRGLVALYWELGREVATRGQGHSVLTLHVAGPVVRSALAFVLDAAAAPARRAAP